MVNCAKLVFLIEKHDNRKSIKCLPSIIFYPLAYVRRFTFSCVACANLPEATANTPFYHIHLPFFLKQKQVKAKNHGVTMFRHKTSSPKLLQARDKTVKRARGPS